MTNPELKPDEPLLRPNQQVVIDGHISGNHLKNLPDYLDISRNRLCGLLLISTDKFYFFCRHGENPIPNRTLALHIRLLYEFPQIVPPATQYEDLAERAGQQVNEAFSGPAFALLLGLGVKAGYRLLQADISPTELASGLMASIERFSKKYPTAGLRSYYNVVAAEAKISGIVDLSKIESWTNKEET